MAERKYSELHYKLIEDESKEFLNKWIGRHRGDDWDTLYPLFQEWKARLAQTVSDITDEYFNWFNENLDR